METLRRGHDRLLEAMRRHALDEADSATGAVAAVAHAAYHLGAVRQKVKLLESGAAE